MAKRRGGKHHGAQPPPACLALAETLDCAELPAGSDCDSFRIVGGVTVCTARRGHILPKIRRCEESTVKCALPSNYEREEISHAVDTSGTAPAHYSWMAAIYSNGLPSLNASSARRDARRTQRARPEQQPRAGRRPGGGRGPGRQKYVVYSRTMGRLNNQLFQMAAAMQAAIAHR